MNIPKKAVLAAICFILLVFSGAPNAKAAAVDDAVEIFKECPVYSFNMDSIKDDHIIVTWKYSNNYTTDSDHGNYTNPFIDIEGFEIQVCTDKTYPEDKVRTYTTADYVENVQSAEYTYKIPVSILGKNGGKLYARIRAKESCLLTSQQISGWGMSYMVTIKISPAGAARIFKQTTKKKWSATTANMLR